MIHLCFYSHTESAAMEGNMGRGPSRQLPCSRAWAEHRWRSVAPFCPWLYYTLAQPQSLETSSAKDEPEALPKTQFLPLPPQSMEPQATLKRKGMKTQSAGSVQFSSVHSLSRIQLFAAPWTAAHQASLSITNSQSPTKPMSIELVMPSNLLILCHPLLLLSSIFPSIRVFPYESALHIRWPMYWSLNLNISPSNEHTGLISFRMDWLDLLAVQGTLQRSSPTPQFKSINSSALSFLYSPTLTSIHDHWKNKSLD